MCFSNANIQEERTHALENMQHQAKKMKLLSNNRLCEASVGKTVRIPVPDVDRGKGDARNILGVILEVTAEGFYSIGTRNGKLKQLYSRSQFSICDENLLTVDEVPSTEFSLRQVATMQSNGTGQGMEKCFCKTKCITNKCSCKKIGRKCNSRCHQSTTCCNKY